jgi:oligopeptide/dipeptide ABC transporter ATP-binding protein
MIFQDPAKSLNPAMPIREQVAEVFYQHRADELLAGLNGRVPATVRRHARQQTTAVERFLLRVPPLRSYGQKLRTRVDSLVGEALAETQISNPRKIMACYPHELSGGMKQRVMIAQALACNPDLLIADEPTTALDVTVQARILELIRELQRRRRTSVLYISHDLSLVKRICDRVAVMYAGRIAEVGSTASVFDEHLHPYTRGLLAAIPTRAHVRGQLAAIEGSVPELVDPPPSCRFHTRCSYAVGLCGREDPPLIDHAGTSHPVACFAYESRDRWQPGPDGMPDLNSPTK